MTSPFMENLAFHSLPRRKMTVLPTLTHSTYTFLCKSLGEFIFWTWGWKGYIHPHCSYWLHTGAVFDVVTRRVLPTQAQARWEVARGFRNAQVHHDRHLQPILQVLEDQPGTAMSQPVMPRGLWEGEGSGTGVILRGERRGWWRHRGRWCGGRAKTTARDWCRAQLPFKTGVVQHRSPEWIRRDQRMALRCGKEWLHLCLQYMLSQGVDVFGWLRPVRKKIAYTRMHT